MLIINQVNFPDLYWKQFRKRFCEMNEKFRRNTCRRKRTRGTCQTLIVSVTSQLCDLENTPITVVKTDRGSRRWGQLNVKDLFCDDIFPMQILSKTTDSFHYENGLERQVMWRLPLAGTSERKREDREVSKAPTWGKCFAWSTFIISNFPSS